MGSEQGGPDSPITYEVDGENVQIVGRMQTLVESKSTPGEWYATGFDDETDRWTCTCKGWTVRKTCRHAVAVRRLAEGEAVTRFMADGKRYRVVDERSQ